MVDNSAKMLAVAERHASDLIGAETIARRVRFHHANAARWMPPAAARYDLIVSHFFFDCFSDDELGPLVQRFAAAAATETCRWLVSEFRQPEQGFAAWRARLWIGGLYRLFGWTTGLRVRRLPAHSVWMERQAFRRTKSVVAEGGLLTSELWERP